MSREQVSSSQEQFDRQIAQEVLRQVKPAIPDKFFIETPHKRLTLKQILSEQYIQAIVHVARELAFDAPGLTHIISDDLSGHEHAVLIRRLINLMRANLYDVELPPLEVEFWDMGRGHYGRVIHELMAERLEGLAYDYSQVLLVTDYVDTGRTISRVAGAFREHNLPIPKVLTINWSGYNLFSKSFSDLIQYVGGEKSDVQAHDFSYWWGLRGSADSIHPQRPDDLRDEKQQKKLNTLRDIQELLAETIFWQLFGDLVRPKG